MTQQYNVAESGGVIQRIRRSSDQQQAADFDDVERGQSILQDMRAGRAKAPRRRPPTSAMSSSYSSTESAAGAQNSDQHHQHANGGGHSDGMLICTSDSRYCSVKYGCLLATYPCRYER